MLYETKSMINVLIMGRANTGKTSLCSVLSNPPREQGFYFSDPPFEFINIRQTSDSVAFIDTKSLLCDDVGLDDKYIETIIQYHVNNHVLINMVIVCLQNNRLKEVDHHAIWLIKDKFPTATIVLYISHRSEIPSAQFKQFITHQLDWDRSPIEFTYGNLILSDEFDIYGGSYIENVQSCFNVRESIYSIIHMVFGLIIHK